MSQAIPKLKWRIASCTGRSAATHGIGVRRARIGRTIHPKLSPIVRSLKPKGTRFLDRDVVDERFVDPDRKGGDAAEHVPDVLPARDGIGDVEPDGVVAEMGVAPERRLAGADRTANPDLERVIERRGAHRTRPVDADQYALLDVRLAKGVAAREGFAIADVPVADDRQVHGIGLALADRHDGRRDCRARRDEIGIDGRDDARPAHLVETSRQVGPQDGAAAPDGRGGAPEDVPAPLDARCRRERALGLRGVLARGGGTHDHRGHPRLASDALYAPDDGVPAVAGVARHLSRMRADLGLHLVLGLDRERLHHVAHVPAQRLAGVTGEERALEANGEKLRHHATRYVYQSRTSRSRLLSIRSKVRLPSMLIVKLSPPELPRSRCRPVTSVMPIPATSAGGSAQPKSPTACTIECPPVK